MTSDRTRSVNSLTALLRSHDLGLDARRALTAAQTVEVSRWRAREEEVSARIARIEAVRLAKRVLEIEAQLKENEKQLTELVQVSEAAPLLQEKGSDRSRQLPASQHGLIKVAFAARRRMHH